MYIIEAFVKWINKNKRGNSANPNNIYKEGLNYNPDGDMTENEIDEAEFCEHSFMPVDSTGNVLACIKCGFVVKKRVQK